MVKNSVPKFPRLKKFFQNRYFVLRHGASENQAKNFPISRKAQTVFNLTLEGREEVSLSAKKLKKEKINLIAASDIERTKQTAEIISLITGAKIIFDKRLGELDSGKFNGCPSQEIWEYLQGQENPAFAAFPNGETLADVRKRVCGCLTDLDKKYEDQTIIIVSHEFPLMVLEWTLKGMDLEEIIEKRHSGKIKKMETGSFRELFFQNRQKPSL